MNDYWLSQSAHLESKLDTLRCEFDEMQRNYVEQIQKLERQLLEANLNAQSRGVTSENIQ